jgi:hypothetical protein
MGIAHKGASRTELLVKGSLMVAMTGLLGAVDVSLLIALGDKCTGSRPGEVPCVSIWSRPEAQDFLPGLYLGFPAGAVAGLVQSAGMRSEPS